MQLRSVPHRRMLLSLALAHGLVILPNVATSAEGDTLQTSQVVSARIETSDRQPFVGEPVLLRLVINIRAYRDPQSGMVLTRRQTWRSVSLAESDWGPFQNQYGEPVAELAGIPAPPAAEPVDSPAEGATYEFAVERKLVPRRSGRVALESVRLSIDYPTMAETRRGLLGVSQLVVTETREIAVEVPAPTLEVREIPTVGQPELYRGAVGRFSVTATAEPLRVSSDEPILLRISVAGASGLERLPPPPVADFEPLTDSFGVSSRPVAIDLTEREKTFSFRVRPRSATVSQIPAIPMSYFDPDLEEFVTIRTEPIELEVLPDSVRTDRNSRATSGPLRGNIEREALQIYSLEQIGPASRWSDGRWRWLALGFGPLFYVTVLGRRWWRERPSVIRSRVSRRLQRAITRARSPHELTEALLTFAKESERGFGKPERAGPIGSPTRLSSESRATLDLLVDECERLRYGLAADSKFDDVKSAAALWASSLKWEPLGETPATASLSGFLKRPSSAPLSLGRGAGGEESEWTTDRRLQFSSDESDAEKNEASRQDIPSPLSPLPRERGKGFIGSYTIQAGSVGTLFVASLVIVIVTGWWIATSQDSMLASETRTGLLLAAERAYLKGIGEQARDPTLGTVWFEEAATHYRAVVASGDPSAKLQHNLGTTLLLSGRQGAAIACLQAAVTRPFPPNRSRIALRLTKRQLDPETASSFSKMSRRLRHVALARSCAFGITVATWTVLWLLAAWQTSRRRNATIVVLLAATILAGLIFHRFDGIEFVVATAGSVSHRAGPGETFEILGASSEGELLRCLRRRHGFVQVITDQGIRSWFPASEVIGISASGQLMID